MTTATRLPEQLHVGFERGVRLDIEFIPHGTPIRGFEDLALTTEADQYVLWVGCSGMDISQASYEATKAWLQGQQQT